ncbi:MAG: hypothetical protein PHS97_06090 [Oscillospiraceae bacterium]|nr:hypothetical protein [Oscillospiraceae bacterium]
MAAILTKAFSFLLIIFGGYALKKVHFFSETDYRLLSKIVLNLTLPCAVITSFAAGFQRSGALYLIVLVGLAATLVMLAVGVFLARRKDKNCKYFYPLTISGYSIGTFIIPFAQSFVGPTGVVVACMFDIGNSLTCTGFSYALLAGRLESGALKDALRGTVQKLAHSAPFLTYCALLLISLLNLAIPAGVLQLTGIIGSANSFLSFLMIGVMFELTLDAQHAKQVATVVVTRMAGAAGLFLIAVFVLPFSAEIRYVLAMIAFAPIPATPVALTELATGDGTLPSLACSITIVLAMIVVTVLAVTVSPASLG